MLILQYALLAQWARTHTHTRARISKQLTDNAFTFPEHDTTRRYLLFSEEVLKVLGPIVALLDAIIRR